MLAFYVFLPLFAIWFCFVSFLLSRIGGWAALATAYRAKGPPHGKRFNFQSGKVGSVNYGSCLTIWVTSEGLYLQVFPVFRFGHPPLFIPWSEMHDLRDMKILWLWRLVEMKVGSPTVATLMLPFHLIEQRPIDE